MSEGALVSVVMAAYKEKDTYIRKAIESILNQSDKKNRKNKQPIHRGFDPHRFHKRVKQSWEQNQNPHRKPGKQPKQRILDGDKDEFN